MTCGRQIYTAWQGKELLRDLLGLIVTRRHVTPDHSAISAARHRFGSNRLIKLEASNAFGFRNRANQRLRSRCATTRRNRREAHPH